MTRRLVSTGSSFEAQAGYSRAVVDGDWVHVSGTTGVDYATGEIAPDVAAQALRALDTIEAALAEADCAMADVVRVRYYITDASYFADIAPIVGRRFAGIRPAATCIVCGLIDPRMKVEIEVTARRGGGAGSREQSG